MTAGTKAVMPYIWTGLTLFLFAGVFVTTLLYLRPEIDSLLLITTAFGMAGTMFTGIAAYLKSEETHTAVNSQLSAWKQEFFTMAHAEGVIAGAENEQARVAEQLKVKNEVAKSTI